MSWFNNGKAAFTGATGDTQDVELKDPPTDSVTALAFSPTADLLAVGSWDNNVRIYEIGSGSQSQGKAMYSHEGPVFDLCWSKDGSKLFSGGADKAARMFDIQSGQAVQVAAHDAPVKCVRWIETPTGGYLATGSWDKTLKYWDTRSSNPIATVQLPERCYAMDVAYPLLVVGTAERHIIMIDLNNPTNVHRKILSPLKWQTRSISCFPAANGFGIGSIEGRVAIQYVEEKHQTNNFSFKCHRKDNAPGMKDQSVVFAVNCIRFNQQHGTFSTAGSDGTVNFWDKDSRTRLKTFPAAEGPVTTAAFNRTSTIFAYAVSYDWSKGHGGMTPNHVNKVMLHTCKDEEVKPKVKR
ncbi:hypothetical protein BOTBODRAFT_111302 [Botryobasidium botryosum FD-172 SS1]|uniref:Anaphase-promoting complex subunit 4-like WD40 domain-containing protein n=1 Tax=Botryobasidium botryosum (strain FD-172 SS1) TaxID=930990 RepID=A0A067MD89_BOTB1|nr:hypothetical protein BOTBODRAFT_111302 [Botryobasidium botryosum FD-172 SS1]